ncbi:sugar phosphate isomerase/epimerase family protein [Nocardioides sp.]|uniref:sugar phosphate isomerase/epimerase family protein n=1 Tax=Nocardioides sp. TaxID=35761 RepID=UPI0037848399
MIKLGVEAISWHARVASREIDLVGILEEAAAAGGEFVQAGVDYLTAVAGGAEAAADAARAHGLFLRATGRPIGRRYWNGDTAEVVRHVCEWLHTAAEAGSDSLMLYSGVYRPELAGKPEEIRAELDHLVGVLTGAEDTAVQLGVTLLLENASDFTCDELLSLYQRCLSEHVGHFLDLTNIYNVWDEPRRAIERLGPLSRAGHVKDFVLESIWADTGYHRDGYAVRFRYPFEGVTPVTDLVTRLRDVVGDREFCLAVEGLDSQPGVADQVRRLTASFSSLREALEAQRESSTVG